MSMAANKRCHIATRAVRDYLFEEMDYVVINSHHHEQQQRGHTDTLTEGLHSIGHRRTLDPFDDVIEQMAADKHRHRQQVQYAEADADDREEGEKGHAAALRGITRELGEAARPAA